MNYFAKNLKYLREKIGLKQAEVAYQIGFKRTTWNGYETGLSQPYIDGLINIAKYFDITEADLLHTNLSKKGEYSNKIIDSNLKVKGEYKHGFQGEFPIKKYPKNSLVSIVEDSGNQEIIKDKIPKLLPGAAPSEIHKKLHDLELRLTIIEEMLKKSKK